MKHTDETHWQIQKENYENKSQLSGIGNPPQGYLRWSGSKENVNYKISQ